MRGDEGRDWVVEAICSETLDPMVEFGRGNREVACVEATLGGVSTVAEREREEGFSLVYVCDHLSGVESLAAF